MKIDTLLEAVGNWRRWADDRSLQDRFYKAITTDATFPRSLLLQLGHRPDKSKIIVTFGEKVDEILSQSDYGDLSRGQFDRWVMDRYLTYGFDWEDLIGQVPNALGAWLTLNRKNLLPRQYQDLNRFSLSQLKTIVGKEEYSSHLERARNTGKIEAEKKKQQSIVLINDERFYAAIPLNYGACYVFNNAEGVQASFCTGSSSGLPNFRNYSSRGPIIMIADKSNLKSLDGKWQIFAPSREFTRADQRTSNESQRFGKLFPGLMNKIASAMTEKSSEIKNAGYDAEQEAMRLKNTFPEAFGEGRRED